MGKGDEMLAGHNRWNASRIVGIEEITKLSGIEVDDTSGHNVHRCKSRDTIGEEYGMTGRNIARYARLHQTIEPIKEMVDNDAMTMGVAVELSYLSEDEQNLVAEAMDDDMV